MQIKKFHNGTQSHFTVTCYLHSKRRRTSTLNRGDIVWRVRAVPLALDKFDVDRRAKGCATLTSDDLRTIEEGRQRMTAASD